MSGKGKFTKKAQAKGKFQAKGGSNIASQSIKKSVNDYNYYLGSSKQASDYETTTEYLINYIKKVFDYGSDIGIALKSLEPINTSVWKPRMQVSIATTEEDRAAENRQYEIEFKADYDTYSKRVQAYENNNTKAYALLWERCNKAMKNKIEARSDYNRIENNPITLLMAIKEHALNFQENRYSMSIILDAMRTLLFTKQKEGESLQDYTKRFRVARDVLKSHMGGPIILTKFVEAMDGYNENDIKQRDKFREQAFSQFMAYLYLDNADKAKYGSIMTGLNTQQSLGNDQYPKSITESNNVLSNHRFDVTNKSVYKKPGDNDKERKQKDAGREDEDVNLSFAQLEGKCYCCGKAGHKSPSCRDKNKPKEEWAINKAQSHAQAQANTSDTSTVTSVNSNNPPSSQASQQANANQFGWTGAHMKLQFYQASEMRDWILLDNQSSVTVFCNPKMVNNIRMSTNGSMHLATNGGSMVTNMKADLPEWGEVWFNEKAITNIFSYAEMADRYRITYDSEKEDAFIVHLPDKTVRFERIGMNLYVFKPTTRIRAENAQMLNTLEENKTFYTERQFQRAKRARDLFHALGTPSINDFKAIIRMNTINNNPVTTDDIKIAEKLFGPDIGTLKGKTTRRKPLPVVNDYIEIPKELIQAQREVTLCMDGMKVNGQSFLTTISRNIMYRTAQWVKNQTAEVYRDALIQVFRVYNTGGFKITTIHCDNEFRPLMEQISNEFQVTMNYANPQEHVPEAERNNRVIKERVRAAYHRLPFKHLPRLMIKILVTESAKKMNFFPAKNGISPYYSPRMILHQRNLDYARHCQYTFGTYVQAHEEPVFSNTNAPRSLDCIFLRYNDNVQGGHELLHLPTNSLITRRTITPLPLTPAIMNQVHALAVQENMPDGLKIANRTGQLFYDSAWIAGVDYDNEAFEDAQDEDYEDQDTSDNESNDEILGEEDYDEMTPDEIYEAEQLELNDNTQEDDPEPDEGNNENNIEMNSDEIQDEDEEPANETENEEAMLEVNPSTQDDSDPNVRTTRSGRVSRPPSKLTMVQNHLHTQAHCREEYTTDNAKVIAKTMCYMNEMCIDKEAFHFVQSYSLRKGLKKFGQKGRDAAYKEMKQLHDRVVFEPIRIEDLTDIEKRRAMESLIFLVEKRDKSIKGRACANGSSQREYMDRDEAASPTTMTESVMITATIDAKQNRDVMTADIPNAFVQVDIDEKEKGERIIMKIRGLLVNMLTELSPETYEKYVVYEGNNKVLYVRMIKALYGMLQSSLLYYKKFRKDIESIGFKVNPYDPCVANRIVNGKQHTVTWHVDDLKSSHVDSKVNDQFLEWLKKKYASDEIGEVKVMRGKKHDYLAMTLDYSLPGVLRVDMTKYVKSMIDDFPVKLEGVGKFPWTDKLFTVDTKSKKLEYEKAKIFHTFVMKGMFLCKRGRQDIQPGIAFLATRTTEPNEGDWAKLVKIMNFLKATQNEVASMSADDTQSIKWYVDAAFAVHKDFKSHTGATMSLGNGIICSMSTKQKVNTRSSTEAELVGVDDIISKVLWTKLFIEAQGHKVTTNVIYRDNTSAMKLEANGKASSGKRTRHFNIKYFYITDLIERKEVQIKYCPSDAMLADYMTKPLVGTKFIHFRQQIMNSK